MQKNTIISIVGPTAAGKSAIALDIAQQFDGEIICMDSATIYREMDIGTAKPSLEEQSLVKHHLLDIRDASESYSAADFAADTAGLAQDIQARGKLPIICGGTMMYYKSLRAGINDLPQANPEIRAQIEADAARLGWPAMHTRLAEIDPNTAVRLAPNDSQRIQRALEIWLSSQRSMSDWLADAPIQHLPGWDFITISLEPSERSLLHQRIAARYDMMIAAGLFAEVQHLYERGDLDIGMPSIRCVGYRQLWDYIDGVYDDLGTAIERAIAATRQLAKRQITWLRSMDDRLVFDCFDTDVKMRVLDFLSHK